MQDYMRSIAFLARGFLVLCATLAAAAECASAAPTVTVLHSFTIDSDGYTFTESDGYAPGSLVADRNGDLYGTDQGTGCCGDVFKLTGAGFVTGMPFSALGGKH